jgi:microcystin-dependent protein
VSYVGSTPTTQNFIAGTDQFTGNGSSTNFTLSRFVNSTNDIQVTIANVVQNTTSYSVSGNTLTISPAVGNGTVFYVRYLSTTLQSIAPGQGSVGADQLAVVSGLTAGTYGSATAVPQITVNNKGQVTAASEISLSGVPSGAVAYFGMSTAPTGWLKANGATVSRTTYAALFAAIGTTFGAGDGSTTFGLPDLRGEFIRSWDDGRGVDTGRVFGSSQAQNMPNHKHELPFFQATNGDIQFNTSNPAAFGTGSSFSWSRLNGSNLTNSGTANYTLTNNQYSPSLSGDNRPVNTALLACIKF